MSETDAPTKKVVDFKVKKSLLDRVLEGSTSRSNLTKAELQEVVSYMLLCIHGELNWGENVVRDVLGSDGEPDDKMSTLNLENIDYKFEKLKHLKIHGDKRRGLYAVDTGMGGVIEYKFDINPPNMTRKIDFEEYPGPGTMKEIETVLYFYKILKR